MIINNRPVANTVLPTGPQVDETAAVAGDQTTQSASTPALGYTPSPEFVKLSQLVRQQPAVREDRVQMARQRLADGYYNSPGAAAKTASAMVNSLD
jgi:hypothetical protein